MHKIFFLLSLFFYNIILPAFNPQDSSLVYHESNIASFSLDEKLSIANQIFDLLQKRHVVEEQLSQTYKKIRSKNTFTLSSIIATVVLTGVLAGPALSVNYLNKYVTPKKYQDVVDKISIGTAGVIGGLGSLGLARKTGQSLYDAFMYEKEQKAIYLEIDKLTNNRAQIDESIKSIERQYPDFFTISSLDYEQENTYKDLIVFYNDNKSALDGQKINTFLLAHPNYSIKDLIDLCKYKKIQIILSMVKPKNVTSFQSSENLALDIVAALFLAPWYLIFSTTEAMSGNTQEQRLKEINTLDIIIKQLTILALE